MVAIRELHFHLICIENPAGLPIISTLRSPATGPSVIAASEKLVIDYHNGEQCNKSFSPWNLCFEDGIQPVLAYTQNNSWKTARAVDMIGISRVWLENSNIIKTTLRSDDMMLHACDFVSIGEDILVRVFEIENTGRSIVSAKFFHYAPINPTGMQTFYRSPEFGKFQAINYAMYDRGQDCIVFSEEKNSQNFWFMGSDQKSTGHYCGLKPEIMDGILSGILVQPVQSPMGVVDAALEYEFTLYPEEKKRIIIYICNIKGLTQDDAINQFKSLVTRACLQNVKY